MMIMNLGSAAKSKTSMFGDGLRWQKVDRCKNPKGYTRDTRIGSFVL